MLLDQLQTPVEIASGKDWSGSAPVRFEPGDRVVYLDGGRPEVCTVLAVAADRRLRVRCANWPRGYSALVPLAGVSLLERAADHGYLPASLD